MTNLETISVDDLMVEMQIALFKESDDQKSKALMIKLKGLYCKVMHLEECWSISTEFHVVDQPNDKK